MTKYFYTDPLAAAWMAKQFGMKFSVYFPPHHDDRCWISTQDEIVEYINSRQARFRIHPDSVKLLEPQDGDGGIDEAWNLVHFSNGKWIYGSGSYGDRLGKFEIIRRNGIAFMWPEVEA